MMHPIQPGSTDLGRAPPSSAPSRRWALPALALALGAYVVLHSPLRSAIAGLAGRASDSCYFVCHGFPAGMSLLEPLAAWLLVAVALLAAWAATEWLDAAAFERPVCFGLCALTLVTAPAAAVAGLATLTGTTLLRPPLGPLLSSLPAAGILALAVRGGWRPRRPRIAAEEFTPLLRLISILAAALLLGSAAINLVHPPTGGDGLSYHAPLAVFLWQDGDLTSFLDRAPGTWALANPGTAELWYGLLRVAGTEVLADFGQLPFALLGAAAAGAFTRHLGLGRGAAWLAALAFLLSPLVVMQIGMQPNDVIGAALLMTTVALASRPVAEWDARRALLLGLGLALTATTRLVLLPSVVAVAGFAVVAVAWSFRRRPSAAPRLVATAALGFLAVAGPWWLRNVVRYGNPVYPAGIPLIGKGVFVGDYGKVDHEFVPHAAAWPLYPVIEPLDDRTGHGALFVLGALPGLVAAVRRGRRQPLLLYAVMVAVMVPSWWWLTMHEPRFFLAHAGLGFAFLPWALASLPAERRKPGYALVAAAAVYSAAVTVDQALLPFARQPTERREFYDRAWAVDPAATGLAESEGLLHQTGYASGIPEYAAYYPLLGPAQKRRVIPVDTEGTTEVLLDRMRAAGVRYAYVVASAEHRATVEDLYPPARFELMHQSVITRGERSGARRYLYRPTREHDGPGTFRRSLYRLIEGGTP